MPETKSKRPLLWIIVAILGVAFLYYLHKKIHFDWHALGRQLRYISIPYVLIGVLLLYIAFALRAVRWAVLLAPQLPEGQKVSSAQLLAPQLIGFTAVALVGRVADLARPYLIARRTKLPVASQLAIYSIERAFDLAAAAILFSVTLALAPHDLPHHEAFVRAGIVSLILTAFIAIFAFALRIAGTAVAGIIRTLLSPLSRNFATKLADRVLDFRQGLQTVSSLREFFAALAVSLVMWGLIASGYLLSARAFVAEPKLATLSITSVMLVLATGLGGSLFQLPILGWFTQIAVIATAYDKFFSVPVEAATACGTVTFFVTMLSIIPAGLIAAHLSGITLRQAANVAETASGAPEEAPLSS